MTTSSVERLVGLFDSFEELSRRRDAWQIQARWRAVFAPGYEDWGEGEEWDVLGSGRIPRFKGAKAISLYEAVGAKKVLVCAALGSPPVYRCSAAELPSYATIRAAHGWDLYIISADWDWTLVCTHEAGHGPYFINPSPTFTTAARIKRGSQ